LLRLRTAFDTFVARYGPEVESYLEVYLKTPGLSKEDIAKALLARGNARKQGGEKLLAMAQQGMFVFYVLFVVSLNYLRFPGCPQARPWKSRAKIPSAKESGEYLALAQISLTRT